MNCPRAVIVGLPFSKRTSSVRALTAYSKSECIANTVKKKPVCTDPDYQLQEEVVLETGDDSTSSFCTGEEEVKKYPSTGHKEILGSVRWKKTTY